MYTWAPRGLGTDHAASEGGFPSPNTMKKKQRAFDIEQRAIHEITQALRSTPELERTLGTVVDVLSKRLGVSHAMVTLVTPSGELELVASSGAPVDGSASSAAERGGAMLPMSLVGVPIKASGRDLGVLSCARPRGEPYTSFQQDVRLLSIVAHLIGEAVKLPEGPAPGDESVVHAQRVH